LIKNDANEIQIANARFPVPNEMHILLHICTPVRASHSGGSTRRTRVVLQNCGGGGSIDTSDREAGHPGGVVGGLRMKLGSREIR
jgi:hypothetical protein